jgi:hypothetical protein
MQYIKDKYGIPVKRGMTVRNKRNGIGRITSCTHYVFVRHEDSRRVCYHPGDLDYRIDDTWFMGDEYIDRFNFKIEAWNAAMNRRFSENSESSKQE